MKDIAQRFISGCVLALLTVLCTFLGGIPFFALSIFICLMAAIEWGIVFCSHEDIRKFQLLGFTLIYAFYRSVLNMRENNINLLIATFFVVWATDTGSYFCGKILKGEKLCIQISPNKTVAGFWGGLGFGTLTGTFFALTPLHAFTVSIFSQFGDLLESYLKRIAFIKDSNIDGLKIPGHGGFLDRIDALIFASPISLLYATLFN